MFVRSGFPFNYDTNEAGDESALLCEDESLTQQSQAEEADINTIVRRFHLSGAIPAGVKMPSYQDYGDYVFDYQSALHKVREADIAFGQLEADTRKRFDNDPQKFLEFCTAVSDDGKSLLNLEEMRLMGLAVPKAEAPAGASPSSDSAPTPSA